MRRTHGALRRLQRQDDDEVVDAADVARLEPALHAGGVADLDRQRALLRRLHEDGVSAGGEELEVLLRPLPNLRARLGAELREDDATDGKFIPAEHIVQFVDKAAYTLRGSFSRHHRETIELDSIDD